MAYLTFEEFEEISQIELTQEEFDKLCPKASDLLDHVTSYYYVKNDIDFTNKWIASQFKKALVTQIEYFKEVGGTSFESMNSSPQSFSAGRTSVTQNQRNSNQQITKELVAEEVYIHLSSTGLLFRGVNTL